MPKGETQAGSAGADTGGLSREKDGHRWCAGRPGEAAAVSGRGCPAGGKRRRAVRGTAQGLHCARLPALHGNYAASGSGKGQSACGRRAGSGVLCGRGAGPLRALQASSRAALACSSPAQAIRGAAVGRSALQRVFGAPRPPAHRRRRPPAAGAGERAACLQDA